MISNKIVRIFLVAASVLSFSCERDWNNPWDDKANPESWAPSNLVIEITSLTSCTLKWQDNSNGEEGFIIDRKVKNESWINNFAVLPPDKTTFIDNEIELTNFEYTYRVKAFLGSKNSSTVEIFLILPKLGDMYAGGIVFYLNGFSGGLVCAPFDQSTGTTWGCCSTAIGGTTSSIGYGAANTERIVTGCRKSGIAAKICNDLVLNGYSDWFLPSKDELNLMYQNLKVVGIGGFASAYYWSSSEYNSYDAWKQYFSEGWRSHDNKDNGPFYVRAVRAF